MDSQQLQSSRAPPQAPANTVISITNAKLLNQSEGIFLIGHDAKQVTLFPETMRNEYHPGSVFGISIQGMEVDYMNIEDSYLWGRVHFRGTGLRTDWANRTAATEGVQSPQLSWDNFQGVFKPPPLGGASYIQRFRIHSGTTTIQDIEVYNLFYGVVAGTHALTRFKDYQTLLNCNLYDAPIQNMQLSKPDPNSTTGARVSLCPIWVIFPAINVLSECGYVPTYQTGQGGLRWDLTLAGANTPLSHDVRWGASGPVDPKYVTTTEGTEVQITTYPGSGQMGYRSMCVPGRTFAAASPVSLKSHRIHEATFTWFITDIQLRVSGLRVVNPGELDGRKVEVFTRSFTTMVSPIQSLLPSSELQ